jgi:hypothetical protein
LRQHFDGEYKMATVEKRFEWLKEILEEKPETFSDYFKEDLSNFLDIETIESNDLRELFGKKYLKFSLCKNKEELRSFVGDITSYVVMKSQTEEIIADYLS